jgi:hypothetical protein
LLAYPSPLFVDLVNLPAASHHIGIARGVGSLGNYLARTEGPTKLGRSRCRWVCANNAPFKRLSSAQACAARARVNLRFRHGCMRGLIEEVRFALDSPLEESGFELLVPFPGLVPACASPMTRDPMWRVSERPLFSERD